MKTTNIYNSRQNKPRTKAPIIRTVTKAMAKALENSPYPDHKTFCDDLEEARALGRGRQHRGMKYDGDTSTAARFYGIAARSSYQRRRGRG